MKKITQIFFTITLLFISLNANSAQILASGALYKNDRFIIFVDSEINTSSESAFNILTDYKNISKLSQKIIESKIIKSDQDETTVRTVVRGCVLFFCKKISNTQITRIIDKNNIESNTIPELSDFKFGQMTWNVEETKNGTTIIKYYAEIEPDFFVPPLIGSYFIKKSMVEEAELLAIEIEKRANEPESQKDPL